MKPNSKFDIKTFFIASAFIFLHLTVFAQVQKGKDIYGEGADDRFGASVSMPDANTLAVGAPANSGGGMNAGHVRVFTWRDSGWVQKGKDIEGKAYWHYGNVLMPDSNTIAIGASGARMYHYKASGLVRVHKWDGSEWVQKGGNIVGEEDGDGAGWSLSMPDANTLAIGAPWNGGYVRVYAWGPQWFSNGTSTPGTWVQKGGDIVGESSGDLTGWSISMPDANTLAIGAPQGNGETGNVRVYTWSGSKWVQKGEDINGKDWMDWFGTSVSMPDANTLAIGALGGGPFIAAGNVRVYNWNGVAWVQKGLAIGGKASEERFSEVCMPDTNTIAIWPSKLFDVENKAGHIRVYSWKESGWAQKGIEIAEDADGLYPGLSISMPDANTLAIGAYGNHLGHVQVYNLIEKDSHLVK